MFTNFVRNIVQFGGTSLFEKARLAATYKGDYDQPNETDIQALLLTLSGKDPETRPQIGFTTIVGKMDQSQSKSSWNYLIKNLIILDRCLEYQFFVWDIATLDIAHVQNFTETDPKLRSYGIDYFIRRYFQYIKKKAQIYSNKKTSFNIPQEERKNYFKSQQIERIFEELDMGQQLFDEIIDLGICDRHGLLKFTVNQYVYQLLLYTLLNVYYNYYISIICLLEKLLKMTLEQAKHFKELYTNFLKSNEILINFINVHLFVKGFTDINTKDIAKVDYRIIGSIDDYLKIAENNTNQVGLPDEVQLEADLIEEELIFKAVDTIRKSIHNIGDEQKHIFHQTNHKLTIIPKQKTPLVTQEQKIKDYIKKKPNSLIDLKCLDTFKQSVFWEYFNNFSTDYIPIDPHYKSKQSVPRCRESTDPSNNLNHIKDDYENTTLIEFKQPPPFQEELFIKFINKPCFEATIDDFDQFPNQVDEDAFEDYDENNNDFNHDHDQDNDDY